MSTEKEMLPEIEEKTVQENTNNVEKLFKTLSEMPNDFYLEDREDEAPQNREKL